MPDLKKIGDKLFCPNGRNFFWPKRMQGSRDIRPFIDRVTELHHFYSLYGWVKIFMLIFNKLPYSLHLQGDDLCGMPKTGRLKTGKCQQLDAILPIRMYVVCVINIQNPNTNCATHPLSFAKLGGFQFIKKLHIINTIRV